MGHRRSVLVFGEDTRAFLAVCRSLGRAGWTVDAAPWNFRAPALRSKYIRNVVRIPYYFDLGEEWLTEVERLLDREAYAALVPCDERALLPLHHHRDRLSSRTVLALPHPEAVEILFDKHRTRELAQAANVAVAHGGLLTAGLITAADIEAEFGVPLMLKPRWSYRMDALYQRQCVNPVRTRNDLEQSVIDLEPDTHIAESLFPGVGVGVSILADAGQVLQAFQHERVHEMSPVGGSAYRKSVPLDDGLTAAVAHMVAATRYTGVAMFEFKVNKATGGWVLLEINARPWGSLPLPLSLGIDFPARWLALIVDRAPSPPVDYRSPVHGRNLVMDIPALLEEARSRRRRPGALLAWAARTGWELLRVAAGRDRNDTLVIDDMRPGLNELGAFAGTWFGKRLGWQRRAMARARARSRRDLAALHAQGRLTGDIVFLCLGNINRSPYAAARLLSRLEPGAPLSIMSAGMLPLAGRPSPALARQSAARHGIDLSDHRSCHLTPACLERAALIIVFDDRIHRAFYDRYPGATVPLIRLDAFADDRIGLEGIRDPVDQPAAVFETVYTEIDAAIDGMLETLRRQG